MRKFEFQRIVDSLPGLCEEGFMDVRHPAYPEKRKRFLQSAVFLQQTLDAEIYLSRFQKSVLVSSWQKSYCRPSKLKDLVEWHSQRQVSQGAIIVAAAFLGFRVVTDIGESEPYFNIFARQLEAEFRDYRVRQLIKNAVAG